MRYYGHACYMHVRSWNVEDYSPYGMQIYKEARSLAIANTIRCSVTFWDFQMKPICTTNHRLEPGTSRVFAWFSDNKLIFVPAAYRACPPAFMYLFSSKRRSKLKQNITILSPCVVSKPSYYSNQFQCHSVTPTNLMTLAGFPSVLCSEPRRVDATAKCSSCRFSCRRRRLNGCVLQRLQDCWMHHSCLPASGLR